MVKEHAIVYFCRPPFTLVYPLFASIRAMESNTQSRYQSCLVYWVLCSIATFLEPMLAKLLSWSPFWPYAKGITIFLLVVPYFRGASYVYFHFIRPCMSRNEHICDLLLIPRTKVCLLNEQNEILGAAESYAREKDEDESEKFTTFEVKSKSNHDNIKRDLQWPTSPKKIQKEWSCAVCLISASSKKNLEKHFRGKKHNGKEEEHRRNEVAPNETISFSVTKKTDCGTSLTSIGNLNQIKWVNLKKLSSLLGPVTGSISWCRWKKPRCGWMKLNADGSVDRDHAGFGGLLRDHRGSPICAYASKAPRGDIFLVELWAIWRGLVLAVGLGIKAIWVESDSMSVVKTINKEQPYSPRASSCLNQVWKLLKKFQKYKVTHSWRETNRAADHLSKMNLVGSDAVIWPADFPNRLRTIIEEDAEGRWYRRG
ncbi:uncharacterized protein LOC127808938 isoform X2 [Diospyros lotus]|uniref:uncharacterized protein LOC127808938 isoform X2 n=1 Tax=Diospyros lotus TaxID=55363 RepID=UPI0022539190|nr:uncharacterized protein LOC127808938 isoform X2 [Diospyros lotus]